MYDVIFYSDSKGNEPIADFIYELRQKSSTNKDARINFNKIIAYINLLSKNGTRIGEPVTKYLDGDIWELRPLDNRILYAYYKDNTFILLHHFIK
jgi:phage-related protein